jgi:hypothetical protein
MSTKTWSFMSLRTGTNDPVQCLRSSTLKTQMERTLRESVLGYCEGTQCLVRGCNLFSGSEVQLEGHDKQTYVWQISFL